MYEASTCIISITRENAEDRWQIRRGYIYVQLHTNVVALCIMISHEFAIAHARFVTRLFVD